MNSVLWGAEVCDLPTASPPPGPGVDFKCFQYHPKVPDDQEAAQTQQSTPIIRPISCTISSQTTSCSSSLNITCTHHQHHSTTRMCWVPFSPLPPLTSKTIYHMLSK